MRFGVSRVAKDDSGATAIEYGLFAVLLGLMLVVGTPFMRTATIGSVNGVSSSYAAATAPAP
ncbi:MAG: Flp family type IVb pilin [Stutzerimonas stutzeri]|nr:MAG: Flp family type IVb pilin [Stutzerimonas stutzeri]